MQLIDQNHESVGGNFTRKKPNFRTKHASFENDLVEQYMNHIDDSE